MDLAPYVATLARDLATAAAAGGDEARALAERLVAPLDSSVRLLLLHALSEAADEISSDLAPGSVHVRLRNGEPTFVVTPAPPEPAEAVAPQEGTAPPPYGDEGATARINLRLPEPLKLRVEAAAAGEGLSVNSWLVRAVTAAVSPAGGPARPATRHKGQSFSGWVR